MEEAKDEADYWSRGLWGQTDKETDWTEFWPVNRCEGATYSVHPVY